MSHINSGLLLQCPIEMSCRNICLVNQWKLLYIPFNQQSCYLNVADDSPLCHRNEHVEETCHSCNSHSGFNGHSSQAKSCREVRPGSHIPRVGALSRLSDYHQSALSWLIDCHQNALSWLSDCHQGALSWLSATCQLKSVSGILTLCREHDVGPDF